MLFCSFSEVFFQFHLNCVWWCVLVVQTDAPFHQAGDGDVKAESVLHMAVSDRTFLRLLEKYFRWLFFLRFIVETLPHNISLDPEHCHRANPEGTDGSPQ